jgi:arsenite methyltransferase
MVQRMRIPFDPTGSESEGHMEREPTFFDFAAEVGLTKHIGGVEGTETLLALCRVGSGSYVLDVGCGAGVTPCFIAKKYGCRVAGVDILEGMVARSRERAEREDVADRVEFRQADAQDLPFADGLFDAVITESVTAFPEDKQRAVNEYVRVTKPGGYIGLNESTWLKTPPPPELVAWVSQDIGATVEPLTAAEWTGLLENAGLRDIFSKTCTVDVQAEAKGIFRRYGCAGMLGIYARILSLYLRNPAYRAFVKEAQKGGLVPRNYREYFGYGLYVGRK